MDDDTRDSRSDFLARFLEIETSLYRYVCAVAPVPQDARDIVQETALALWEHDDRYDPSRPFLPWALRVARNKARQHAEKAGRFPRLLEDEALLDLILAESEEHSPAGEDRQAHLRACLDKLRPEHFQLIDQLGRWVHLTTVYDAPARRVRLYVDGEFDNEMELPHAPPAVLGPAQIGNWDTAGHPWEGSEKGDRRLSGRMDELLIFTRLLGDKEIARIHQLGSPYEK